MTRESCFLQPTSVLEQLTAELGEIVALDARHLRRFLPAVQSGRPAESAAKESAARDHQAARRSRVPKVSGAVAVIRLHGVITPRNDWYGMSVETFETLFDAALATDRIRGIVIDTDTPGGSVYGIPAAARKIYDARGSKPVVAITNSLNASAGYYLTSAADRVYAVPGSDTGSIGVWSMHVNQEKWLEELGIELRLFSAGKYKVEGHPFGPLDEEGETEFQRRVDGYYEDFLSAVARHRGVTPSTVRNGFGEGRVVGATKAAELGMVDRVLTMDQLRASMGVARSGSSAAADADLQAYFAEALGLDAEPEEPGDDGPEPPAADSRTPPAAGTDTDEDGEQTPNLNESGENVEIRRKRLQLRQQMCRLT